MAVLRKAAAPPKRPVVARKPKPKPKLNRKPRPVVARNAPAPGTLHAGMVVGTAGTRRYSLYRPAGLKPGERMPLLVMLHGCGQDAAAFASSTRMNAIAARERFIVLYPEQDRLANAQGCWNWFETRSGRVHGELALIMAAVDQACTMVAVDRDRVAIAGLSAGASMAALLVALHPERFRALVMHSGVPPGSAYSTLTALSAMRGRRAAAPLQASPSAMANSWPPLLVIHGTADHVVALRNGRAAAQLWADAAGAHAVPARPVQRGKRHAMTLTDFTCKGRVVATLAEVGGLGHAWSGGAASQAYGDAQGPDASRMVWAFAARQFRGTGG